MRALVLAVAFLSLAGCLSTVPPEDATDTPNQQMETVYGTIKSLVEDVPCQVESVGTTTSENFLPLSNASWDQGGTQELEIRGDLLFADRPNGISIVDIADPMNPVVLSNYTDSGYPLDVKVSPDNMTALVGMTEGVDLVDVRDPSEPHRVGQWLFPGTMGVHQPLENAHMLFTAEISDEQWVFVAPNTNTGVWILKLEGSPDERKLTFVTQTLPAQGGPLGPHDMIVQFDPVLKTHLLYSADGYHGWSVWNVGNPAEPELVGGFIRPETGYLHTIQATFLNNRRIVVTIAEVGANFMEVYDATNLRTPVLLATWQVGNPSESQHNFNLVQGLMYLAHYAQGIYVFDLTELPATPSQSVVEFPPVAHWAGREGASFWDIVMKDGVLYGSDMRNGVDVFGYGCIVPGEPTYTSIN
jgi:hypothetical protein